MSSSIAPHFANMIIRWIKGEDMPAAPANTFLGLFNGNPRTTGTEVTSSVRPAGRQSCPFDAVADDDQIALTTSADALFGNSSNAVTITHVTLHDDSVNVDTLLAVYALDAPVAVDVGSPVKFPAGTITFTIGSAT